METYITISKAEDNFKQKYPSTTEAIVRATAEAEHDQEAVYIYRLVAKIAPTSFEVNKYAGMEGW